MLCTFFLFSLIPTFLLLTFFLKEAGTLRSLFKQVLHAFTLLVTQPKSSFSEPSTEFTTKAELHNMIFYVEDKKKLNKPVSV